MSTYRALAGLSYRDPSGKECRAEAGELVDSLPRKSVEWLLRQGHIEAVVEEPVIEADEGGDE